MANLFGTVTLITGASSGIGRSIALAVTQSGGGVILVGRSSERLGETAAMLPPDLVCGTLVTDLSDPTACCELVPKALALTKRPLDGLVHSAGVHAFTPIRTLDVEVIDHLWAINVRSLMLMSKSFRTPSSHAKVARIIAISSTAAQSGQKGLCAYSATKGAINALTRSMAIELAPDGIRVNCIAPGMVETPMQETLFSQLSDQAKDNIVASHPLGLGSPRSVAHATTFLLSSEADWITGTTLTIDGGYTAGKS